MADAIDDTIAALHEAGATDDEITGILKEKFGQKPQSAPVTTATGNVANDVASESGSYNFSDLADVGKGFVKSAGRTIQAVGNLPHMVGLPGLTEATDAIYGMPHGSSENSMKATNPAQKLGGYAETATELLPTGAGFIKGAQAAPGLVARGFGVSKVRASANLADAASSAAKVVLDVNKPGVAAIEALKFKDAGASMPNVVRTFLARATDPAKGPLTFEEGRRFYSNLSRLSGNELGNMNANTQRLVGDIARSLQESLTEAARTVGKGEEYAAGIKEYARHSSLVKKAPTMVKTAIGLAGGAEAVSLINRLLKAAGK